MKIQYLGHSSFRIISDIGTTIVTDPYNKELVGYQMPKVRCDVVTVSHQHDDHNFVEALAGNPAVVDKVLTCPADDIALDGFVTFHDAKGGSERGLNTVFCFSVDGIKVAHMGDIGEKKESIVDRLENTDILMIPVGGYYTIDALTAKWYVDNIRPKIVLPMHYATEDGTLNIGSLDTFTDLFDDDDVEYLNSDTLDIDQQPDYPTKVLVLPRYKD